MEKEYVKADDLFRASFSLGKAIFDSGYRPEALLAVWRGGTPVGIVIHEFLRYRGLETYHAVIKSESYEGIGIRTDPRFEHVNSVLSALGRDSRVLIVDDIFDTGSTVRMLRERLADKTGNVKVATLYYKKREEAEGVVPDFYWRETSGWIVFPHELCGLTDDEIRAKDPELYRTIAGGADPSGDGS